MFFVSIDGALDAVALEQTAALCARCDTTAPTQPAARAWVRSLQDAPSALIAIGRETNEVLAFAAGALERNEQGLALILHELCVSDRRVECGIGSELLEYVLRQARARGATLAIASARLESRGAAFLEKHEFARSRPQQPLRRVLAPPR